MQRLEDLSKDFKALNSQVTKVDLKTEVSKFSLSFLFISHWIIDNSEGYF